MVFQFGAFSTLHPSTRPYPSGDQYSPSEVVLLILLFAALFVVCALAVRFPFQVVRIHALLARRVSALVMGANWEHALERSGRGKDLDYLRRAPVDPRSFPAQAGVFRVLFLVAGAITFLALACSSIMLFVGPTRVSG